MIDLLRIRACVTRLYELEDSLLAEMKAWEKSESPLLPGEREQYLEAIQAAVAGLYDARDTLEAAVERLEGTQV